jgi:hypothetical protein
MVCQTCKGTGRLDRARLREVIAGQKQRVAEAKEQVALDEQELARLEDLLWVHWVDDEGDHHWSPRVIRKRTARYVYVDPSAGNSGEETVRLDRARLEAEGEACSRARGYQCFYTPAEKERLEARERERRRENEARARACEVRRRVELE